MGDEYESWSSERLLEAAKRGDQEAFGELTVRYRAYLMAVAARTLGNGQPGDCSSVVQDSLTKAFEHFDGFRGTTVNEFLGWFSAILRHNVIDRLAANKMTPLPTGEEGEVFIEGSDSTPSAQVSGRERSAKLLAAIDQLPADYGQAIKLRYLDDVSYDEIAVRMDRSNVAVRKLVQRGLKRLREQIGDDL